MTEELDAIFFDLGGTLIDTTVSRERVWANVLRGHGHEVADGAIGMALREADRGLDNRFAAIQGSDEGPFWLDYDRMVLARLGIHLSAEKVVKDLSESMGKMIMDEGNWKDFDDARPLLERLGDTDIKVGLISNATELARKVLRRLELEKYFDPIIISSEVGHRKPEREIFETALDDSGVAASRAIYIGDKPAVDIVGATSAGMNGILIDRGDVFPDSACIRIRNLDCLRTFIHA